MKHKATIFLALAIGILAPKVTAQSYYYVDCFQGSNGNLGTDPSRPFRSILAAANAQINAPLSGILLRRDCTWYEELTITGTSGSNIVIDSYGGNGQPGIGQPPHLTGHLSIPTALADNAVWCEGTWNTDNPPACVSGPPNIWSARPLFAADGTTVDHCGADGRRCLPCPTAGIFYSCLSQALSVLNFVRFGTVWGNNHTADGSLSQDRDWKFDSGTSSATGQTLTVYCKCTGGVDPTTYYEQIVPIVSGVNLVNLNGVQNVTIQHLLLDWFDGYGVQVQGNSTNITVANVAANSLVDNGTVPLGFFVHPTGGPTYSINLYNVDANANYAGFEFITPVTGSTFTLTNCRGYGNRYAAVVDAAYGATNFEYCHFYGNGLATAIETDLIQNPGYPAVDGGHNLPYVTSGVASTDAQYASSVLLAQPWIQRWRRWPAYTTLTFDDPGLVNQAAPVIASELPIIDSRNIPLSMAIVTNGSDSARLGTGSPSPLQQWISAGYDLNVHSVSHEYWNPPSTLACNDVTGPIPCEVFKIQYTGTIADKVTLTITHNGQGGGNLTLNPVPYDPCAFHTWDLTPVPPGGTAAPSQINTIGTIVATLSASCFTLDTTALNNSLVKGNANAYGLADVAGVDVKASQYSVPFNEGYLESDELSWAKAWFQYSNIWPSTNPIYVMPGTYGDAVTENIAAILGFAGVRGTGSLKSTWTPGGADATLARGYDVYNILSQGMVSYFSGAATQSQSSFPYAGLSYAQVRSMVSADVFRNSLWGRPISYFWHWPEMMPDQIENMIDGLLQAGATFQSNTGLVSMLLGGSRTLGTCTANNLVPSGYVVNSFKVCPSTGVEADFRPTVNSPTIGHGNNSLGAVYQYDIMGNQRFSSWDIGAYQYIPVGLK